MIAHHLASASNGLGQSVNLQQKFVRFLAVIKEFTHYCLLMAGNLTQWEKDQIKTIDNLIQKCELRYSEFQSKYDDLIIGHVVDTSEDTSVELRRRAAERIGAANYLKEWLQQELRYFAIDLYSVLDYLCYLCYCHFKNNGNPSDSPEARNVKFPYKNTIVLKKLS